MGKHEDTVRGFLDAAGWGDAAASPIAADWSTRGFRRLSRGGQSAVLMDWPGGAMAQHVAVHGWMDAAGLSVPAILAVDPAQGLLLCEDYGAQSMSDLLYAGADPAPYYDAAVDVLVRMHDASRSGGQPVPVFDAAEAGLRAARFVDFYLPLADPKADGPAVRESFIAAWRAPWSTAMDGPLAVAHYDFHPGNLYWLPDRPPPGRCGMIDFQDAVLAPAGFDLACLLQDVRRDATADVVMAATDRFLKGVTGVSGEWLETAMAVASAQRACQILGGLGRIAARAGLAAQPLQHLQRTWRRLDAALSHPANAPVAAWFAQHARPAWREIGASDAG